MLEYSASGRFIFYLQVNKTENETKTATATEIKDTQPYSEKEKKS